MNTEILYLQRGKNMWLCTVTARLAVLCGMLICDKKVLLERGDASLVTKARSYFKGAEKALNYTSYWKKEGSDFSPETLHNLNVLHGLSYIVTEAEVTDILLLIFRVLDVLEKGEALGRGFSEEEAVKVTELLNRISDESRLETFNDGLKK